MDDIKETLNEYFINDLSNIILENLTPKDILEFHRDIFKNGRDEKKFMKHLKEYLYHPIKYPLNNGLGFTDPDLKDVITYLSRKDPYNTYEWRSMTSFTASNYKHSIHKELEKMVSDDCWVDVINDVWRQDGEPNKVIYSISIL